MDPLLELQGIPMPASKKPLRLTDEELQQAFATELGWSDFPGSQQSRTVFSFLRGASVHCTESTIVLDVSAGYCRVLPFFRHAQYISIDSTVGDETWDFSRLDILGEALDMPIRDSSVDVCLNLVSLEHYEDPVCAFREFARVLKPGGRLYLSAPYMSHEHQIPHDFFRFTRYGLEHLCRTNGLKVETLQPSNSVFESAIGVMHEALEMISDEDERTKLNNLLKGEFQPVFETIDKEQRTFVDYPETSSFHQFPWLYLLCAVKPGTTDPSPIAEGRTELLRQVIACPQCKGSLAWHELQQHCTPCDLTFTMTDRRLRLTLAGSADDNADEVTGPAGTKPSNATAWNDLGVTYNGAGEYAKALACLRKACMLEPNNTLFLLNLGDLCLAQGLPWDAYAAFHAAFTQDPDSTEVSTRFAAVCDKLGKLDEFDKSARTDNQEG
jgi:SAM-dependent methyltransferase